MRAPLQKKTADVAAAFKAADEAAGPACRPDRPSGRWPDARKDWSALESGGLQMKPRDNLLAHTALIRKVMLTLHDLGDDGNPDPRPVGRHLLPDRQRGPPGCRMFRNASAACARWGPACSPRRPWTISGASTQLGELNMTLADFNENLDRAAVADPALRGSLEKLGKEFNAVSS